MESEKCIQSFQSLRYGEILHGTSLWVIFLLSLIPLSPRVPVSCQSRDQLGTLCLRQRPAAPRFRKKNRIQDTPPRKPVYPPMHRSIGPTSYARGQAYVRRELLTGGTSLFVLDNLARTLPPQVGMGLSWLSWLHSGPALLRFRLGCVWDLG